MWKSYCVFISKRFRVLYFGMAALLLLVLLIYRDITGPQYAIFSEFFYLLMICAMDAFYGRLLAKAAPKGNYLKCSCKSGKEIKKAFQVDLLLRLIFCIGWGIGGSIWLPPGGASSVALLLFLSVSLASLLYQIIPADWIAGTCSVSLLGVFAVTVWFGDYMPWLVPVWIVGSIVAVRASILLMEKKWSVME